MRIRKIERGKIRERSSFCKKVYNYDDDDNDDDGNGDDDDVGDDDTIP